MTLRAAAGVRGGGDEVLEVGAKGMGAALTGPVPRWGGPEDPGFLRWPGRLRKSPPQTLLRLGGFVKRKQRNESKALWSGWES